ncbi:MAG: ribosomal RNA small subunit methyltransferase A [Armatimonadetes bacterium]|nr:ribosomal RNA small subunit methyltransferase A [Armatimonadota bacterium]NIM23057.1 ribosomal RNA small subunit methyltransferase A [Armatimonadota bacterium]NIM66925.1 ribosomal RNA small subunit methyltransferase A [Armatimonadota bacterium]NIM75459.1 ribosomal RNA small subunit methyltransferase A [Armatimonadota bacterium]NIN05116.1 ribosomal RNA small subunit methyltransferase A [Armatimonadota bacterium]
MNQLRQPNRADPALPSTLKALLSRHSIRPRKRLGQHFLISAEIADRIVEVARIDSSDCALEIGAGAGALTLRLTETASSTIAIESDPRLVEVLQEILPSGEGLKLMQADILKIDLSKLMGEGTWKVLGNLPYYITGPVLFKLFEQRRSFSSLVVMVQREVADRITSSPGSKEYGGLSVLAQAYFLPRAEMRVKRTCFYPQPEVDSTVVSLTPRAKAAVGEEDQKQFEKLVRASFSHRRKTLENSLVEAGFVRNRQEAVSAMEAVGVNAGRRAESLSVEEFVMLARRLKGGDERD